MIMLPLLEMCSMWAASESSPSKAFLYTVLLRVYNLQDSGPLWYASPAATAAVDQQLLSLFSTDIWSESNIYRVLSYCGSVLLLGIDLVCKVFLSNLAFIR